MSATRMFRPQSLSDIEALRMKWLIPGRVPIGALTLLVGDPGRGKSLLTARWGAQVTRGEVEDGPADAIFLTAEDSPSATLRPRLQAAGAVVERVSLPQDEMGDYSLWLPDDTEGLRQVITERAARLVVIDPLSAHLSGDVNSWQDQSVRAALTPLARLAEAHDCAVIAVAHLRKSGGHAIHRIGGSIGFPALARSVLILGQDPADTDRRVLAHVKCNVGMLAPSLAYVIEAVRQPASDGSMMEVPRLQLQGETDLTADDLMNPAQEGGALQDAVHFLRDVLARAPVPASAVRQMAHDAGISSRTLERAKSVLGIEAVRVGGFAGRGGWQWTLHDTEAAKDAKHDSQNGSASASTRLRTPSLADGALSHDDAGVEQ